MIMMYCKPPIDYTGRGPDRSMNTHCSDQVEQEYVVFRIGNRFPFAIKHPKYGNSSPANVIPSCLVVSTRERIWPCAYNTWKSLMSIVVRGGSAVATTGGTGKYLVAEGAQLDSYHGKNKRPPITYIPVLSHITTSPLIAAWTENKFIPIPGM